MAKSSDELLPVVTVTLFDRAEIEGLVQAALEGSVAFVPLAETLDEGTTYVLELYSPDRTRPIVLAGETAGEATAGMCPMVLRPLDAANAGDLRSFLTRASMWPGPSDKVMSDSRRMVEVRILTPRVPSYPADALRAPGVPQSRGMRPLGEPPGEEGGSITLQSIESPEYTSSPPPIIDVLSPSRINRAPQPPPPPRAPVDPKGTITLDAAGNEASESPPDSAGPPSVTNDPLLGRSIGGKYLISVLIGAGGAGSVYRARHIMLRKDVAIKVMHPSLRKDPSFAERFHAEALAASKLDHPNVLRVIDFGEEPDGLLYIAMELLVGTELRALLWQGRLPMERTLDITCQICAALSAATEVGIVHRDIKPENVVITSSRDDEGQTVDLVKVCDFGLATIVKSDDESSGEQRVAAFIGGTPEYMSPEQVRGEELDGRSDIYAVGILLFELVTGNVPFQGATPVDILKAHLRQPVPSPSSLTEDIDPVVEGLILRSLAKERNLRPATAREMRAELRGVLERMRSPVPKASAPEPTAVTLDDPASGFGELFVALTAAVARTTYYEREHPEFARSLVRLVNASRTPLAGRGEICIAQRDVRDTELFVQTGIGEVLDLRRVVAGGVAEAYGPRLGEVFLRRHVVSFALKEGVTEADLADATELLSGPEVSVDTLRLDFLSRGLRDVSILFSEELLGKSRKLPWHVDLCISRLARDLRALPLLRGVTEEAMRTLRVQLVADVVRGLERPEDIRLLLENTDLVATSVQHITELEALDLRSVIVAALRRPLAVGVARLLLAGATKVTPPPAGGEGGVMSAAPHSPTDLNLQHATGRSLLNVFASRFLREHSPETDSVLRAMLNVKVVDLSDLSPELQLAVAAENLAAEMAADVDLVFRRLAAAPDLASYAAEMAGVTRALAVLASAGDAKTLASVVTGLVAFARGAAPGDTTKEATAASTVASLSDATVLAAVADALLFGPVSQREPARTILVLLGAPSARALLTVRARERAYETFPRPRFVAALREIGRAALPALAEHLSRIDPEGAESSTDDGAILAEDLLRALPDASDESLGRVVARFLRHRAPAVRRAAAAGLPGLLGPRAKPSLVHALDDIDEGVRGAAFAGLRSIRAVDEAVVTRVDEVLNSAAPMSDELRASAVGSLAEVRETAKARAVEVLSRALRPKSRSIVNLFKSSDDGESVFVLTTVARVLLTIGGEGGRRDVERRASSSRGELKKALTALLT